ncbi:MAG: hypothetical protein H7066_06665 [Cytophagaceae bacterium]|nr:hypothetical protein [Gemmatimonadaceae bacterium]
MHRTALRRALAVFASLAIASPVLAQASGGESLFKLGYMDIGPTVGFGGIGSAGIAFGGRFERAIKQLPDLGNGVLGIEASIDVWNYNDNIVNSAYDYRWISLGVTANYHFQVKSNPKVDPFLGLGLGNSMLSTDAPGDYSTGIYFIGRAGIRYFYKPRLALYADAGAGASTLNVGVTFGIGK